jgi:PAS domain S-box-containing protein
MCKILIVDSDITTFDAVARAIPDAEIQNIVYSKMAGDIYRDFAPDIALVSLQVDDCYGFSVVHELADMGAGRMPKRLVAINSDQSDESVSAAFAAGASDIISKPLHPRFVESRIRDMIAVMRMFKDKRNTEIKWDAMFDIFPDPVTITHFDTGEYANVNRAFLNNVNLSIEDVVGKTPVSLGIMLEEDRIRLLNALSRVGEVKGLEIPYYNNGKEYLLALSARVFESHGKKYILSITRDLTTQRDIMARNEILRESVDNHLFKQKLGAMRARTATLRGKVDILRGVTVPNVEPDSGS